jgi:hypothetical protein
VVVELKSFPAGGARVWFDSTHTFDRKRAAALFTAASLGKLRDRAQAFTGRRAKAAGSQRPWRCPPPVFSGGCNFQTEIFEQRHAIEVPISRKFE